MSATTPNRLNVVCRWSTYTWSNLNKYLLCIFSLFHARLLHFSLYLYVISAVVPQNINFLCLSHSVWGICPLHYSSHDLDLGAWITTIKYNPHYTTCLIHMVLMPQKKDAKSCQKRAKEDISQGYLSLAMPSVESLLCDSCVVFCSCIFYFCFGLSNFCVEVETLLFWVEMIHFKLNLFWIETFQVEFAKKILQKK